MIEEYLCQIDESLSINPAVETFPHHLHKGAEDTVTSHSAITGLEALRRILAEVERRVRAGGEEDSLPPRQFS